MKGLFLLILMSVIVLFCNAQCSKPYALSLRNVTDSTADLIFKDSSKNLVTSEAILSNGKSDWFPQKRDGQKVPVKMLAKYFAHFYNLEKGASYTVWIRDSCSGIKLYNDCVPFFTALSCSSPPFTATTVKGKRYIVVTWTKIFSAKYYFVERQGTDGVWRSVQKKILPDINSVTFTRTLGEVLNLRVRTSCDGITYLPETMVLQIIVGQ